MVASHPSIPLFVGDGRQRVGGGTERAQCYLTTNRVHCLVHRITRERITSSLDRGGFSTRTWSRRLVSTNGEEFDRLAGVRAVARLKTALCSRYPCPCCPVQHTATPSTCSPSSSATTQSAEPSLSAPSHPSCTRYTPLILPGRCQPYSTLQRDYETGVDSCVCPSWDRGGWNLLLGRLVLGEDVCGQT